MLDNDGVESNGVRAAGNEVEGLEPKRMRCDSA